jgi:hypothetical protein
MEHRSKENSTPRPIFCGIAEPHVISALRANRAELSSDLIAAQKRLEKLRDDLDAIDRTLRVFDPSQHPESIRPIVKCKGDRMLGYGECTRAILNVLRDALEPMPRSWRASGPRWQGWASVGL